MPKIKDTQNQGGGGDPHILKLTGSNRLRIVEISLDDGQTFKQHAVADKEDSNQVEFLVCPGGSSCPLCRKPVAVDDEGKTVRLWPARNRFAYNVWDYESDSVKVFMTGPSVHKKLEASLKVGYDPIEYDMRIHKMGAGINTSYVVIRGEAGPLPQEIMPDMLHDLTKYDKPATPEHIFEVLEKKGYDYDAIVVPSYTDQQALEFIMPFGRHKGMTVEQVLANDPEWLEWLHDAKLSDGGIGDPVFIALQRALETAGRVPALDESLPSAEVESTEVARDDDRKPQQATAPEAAGETLPEDKGMVKLNSPTGDVIEVPESAVAGLVSSGFTLIEQAPEASTAPEPVSIDDDTVVEVTIAGSPAQLAFGLAKQTLASGVPVEFVDPAVAAQAAGGGDAGTQGDAASDGLENLDKLALKEKAAQLGHKISGTKPELIERIRSGPAKEEVVETASSNGDSNGERDGLLNEVKNLLNNGDWGDYSKLLEMLQEVAGKTNISEFTDDELGKLKSHLTA